MTWHDISHFDRARIPAALQIRNDVAALNFPSRFQIDRDLMPPIIFLMGPTPHVVKHRQFETRMPIQIYLNARIPANQSNPHRASSSDHQTRQRHRLGSGRTTTYHFAFFAAIFLC